MKNARSPPFKQIYFLLQNIINFFFLFNWSIVDLQCCVSFPFKTKWLSFVIVVQLLSRVQLFATPWIVASQAPLSSTITQSLLKFMSIESVMLSNHLNFYYPLFLLLWILPRIRVFPNESALHTKWPKYWTFSFSIYPVKEYSELISF